MSENTTFAELGLRDSIVETLTALGYEAPTPIQAKTIPRLLAGGDIIGQAQTGTGKTAAFALPILERIDPKKKETQALVLAPTRELAMQVAEAIHSYSAKLGTIHVLPVYGGAPIVPQLKKLERGVHVVVGTPGRLIDHLDRGSLSLANVKMIVLDEADEMLKMGFAEEVEKLLSAVPAERQIALFSATMPEEVLRVAKRHLRNPERIEVEHHTVTVAATEQRFLNVSEGQKLEVLTQILELQPVEAVLIFRRTKNGAAELAEKLEARGFAAVAMHGDMTQALRESVIRRLRAGQVEIVVATDVAARGLDVEQIEHVINYDVPWDVEAYVHRIGRTGRAGRTGLATLFITPRERKMMREIERYTGTAIKPMKMPTRADIAAKRISTFKETVRKTIQEGDLEMYVELVEQLAEEGPFDIADVAAAAARIANGSRALGRSKEQESSAPEPQAYSASDRPPARDFERAPRAPRPDREESEVVDKTVTMSMSVGRKDGIRPADVVGSIANEADIPGREIGPIDIQDEVTYVGIPQRYVETVLAKVGKKRFRGHAVNLRVATARSEGIPPSRRSASSYPRKESGDRERTPYARKESGDRERPAYARKESGDRERPAYARKPAGDRDRPAPHRKGPDSAARRFTPAAPGRRPAASRSAGPPDRGRSEGAGRPRAPFRRNDSPGTAKPFYSGVRKGGGGPGGKKRPR